MTRTPLLCMAIAVLTCAGAAIAQGYPEKPREVRERFTAEGAQAAANAPEWFAEHMRRERVRWAAVVRTAGASAQ